MKSRLGCFLLALTLMALGLGASGRPAAAFFQPMSVFCRPASVFCRLASILWVGPRRATSPTTYTARIRVFSRTKQAVEVLNICSLINGCFSFQTINSS